MGEASGTVRASHVSAFIVLSLFLALLAPCADAGEAGPAGLFVLPVDRAWPVGESAGQIFEERLAIALGETKRVKPLAPRDIADAKRRGLPKDLSTCVTPGCLKRLGEATGAARVLGTKLADDAGRPTLFANVYDAGTGVIVQRKEWPGRTDDPPVSGKLATEVALWAAGVPSPAPPAATLPASSPRAVAMPGVLALDLAPGEPDSSQARALLDALGAALGARGGFSVIPRSGGRSDQTQRATVRVEQAHVSLRAHHGEHVREGALAAVLTIADAPSDAVVFMARGHAERTENSKHVGDAQVMSALVDDVVAQWMSAFDSQHVAMKIQRRGSP